MENLKARLEQLNQQEVNLLMQLDEIRVMKNAYETTIKEKEESTEE